MNFYITKFLSIFLKRCINVGEFRCIHIITIEETVDNESTNSIEFRCLVFINRKVIFSIILRSYRHMHLL